MHMALFSLTCAGTVASALLGLGSRSLYLRLAAVAGVIGLLLWLPALYPQHDMPPDVSFFAQRFAIVGLTLGASIGYFLYRSRQDVA